MVEIMIMLTEKRVLGSHAVHSYSYTSKRRDMMVPCVIPTNTRQGVKPATNFFRFLSINFINFLSLSTILLYQEIVT